MVQHDFIGFGEREYVDRRTGATLKVLWADIRESETTGLAVTLKTNIETQLRRASKAASRPSELFSGVALYGRFDNLSAEYRTVIESLEQNSVVKSTESYDERKKHALKLVEICLRSYNNLMDAYRLARLFGACEKLVIQPCIHDRIELTSAIGPWEMVHQTRRVRLSDFVQTCFIRPRGSRWIPAPELCFVAPGLRPPKAELQNLVQEFLEDRAYDWCLHLIDSVEFLLEGDLSRAVVAGNIAMEVAVKEAIRRFLYSQGVELKERDLRRFFEESSLSSQINVLLPMVAPGVLIDSNVLRECDGLRNARHAILHWGHRIENTEAVLRWLNAARELCLTLHEASASE
jgi:hypothetical protein